MMKKGLLTVSTVLAAGAIGYAAGAKKAAVNMPVSEAKWNDMPGSPIKIATLWGNRDKGPEYGVLFKFPGGFEVPRHAHTNDYQGVAISGVWIHITEDGKPVELSPGGYVFQPGKQFHGDKCKGPEECMIMVHGHGKGDFILEPAKK